MEENYSNLEESVRKRIVLENCETTYSISDLLPLCERLSIPLVIDYHHDSLLPSEHPVNHYIPRVLEIWKKRGIKPKFHISEPRVPGGTFTEKRAHSDLIEGSMDILKAHPEGVDLMIEAKLKEQAVHYLRGHQFREMSK